MRLKHTLIAVLPIFAVALSGFAEPAEAIIHQQIILQYDPTPDNASNNDETRDDASIDDSGGPINSAIAAQITDPSLNGYFFARGSVGQFGDLGVEAHSIRPGELDSQVYIESDGYQNITGRPQRAMANFIIDGGRFVMYAGAGSLLEFTLTIRKDFDVVFQSAFEYESLDNSGSNNELRLFGEDARVTQTSPGVLDMDFSFQSVDLGIILPNETFGISYQLDITGTAVNYSEVMLFEFSDPFNVTQFPGDAATDFPGDFPAVTFSDVQAVPSPTTAPLMLGGFGALAVLAHRRQRRRVGAV